MLNLLPEPTDQIRQFRAAPWPFQSTFETPLKDLKRFVSTFLAAFPAESCVISADQALFEAKKVLRLLAKRSIKVEDRYHFTIEAKGKQDVAVLLETLLSDWIDFLFVPTPKSFVIYADHNEYTTFYVPTRKTLDRLNSIIEDAGFEGVSTYYHRRLTPTPP